MSICSDKLLGIKDPCNPLQGCGAIFDVTDAMGFSWSRAANLAQGDGKPFKGMDTIAMLRNNALKETFMDVLQALSDNGWATNFVNIPLTSGEQKNNIIPTDPNVMMGIQITTNDTLCKFISTEINSCYLLSANDSTVTVQVQNNGSVVTSFDINLVANIPYYISNYELCKLKGLKGNIIITGQGDWMPIENKPACGCGGTPINACGKVLGFTFNLNTNAVNTNTSLGYGIVAELRCVCDYDAIICDLPNTPALARICLTNFEKSLCEMALNVDKYTFYNIYDRENIKENYNKKLNEYKGQIKNYINSLRSYFIDNSDIYCGCIKCNHSSIKQLA